MRLAAPLVRAASTSTNSTSWLRSLYVGVELRSAPRWFGARDVAAYADVTGDHNPVHLDDAFARAAGFAEGRLVHGMLAASLFPRLIADRLPGAVYESQSLRFEAPVYVGDKVRAVVQALSISAAGDKHIVKFATRCIKYVNYDFKDYQVVTIDGEAMVSLPTLQLSSDLKGGSQTNPVTKKKATDEEGLRKLVVVREAFRHERSTTSAPFTPV